ncbi:hypothetical protein AOXY_G24917 [Acipenser oxyrinchus oxyrinchus]|uniref:Uncharacterized protein n=1 Tax=Acipenser oxyrinchus oxyrinchus TaxID=40147 RepID=A0AAD8FVD4_ACIOX|nr:hypothetical protein AOXY_G24917 [Acipenser oxyrinchus oxyrinchus]
MSRCRKKLPVAACPASVLPQRAGNPKESSIILHAKVCSKTATTTLFSRLNNFLRRQKKECRRDSLTLSEEASKLKQALRWRRLFCMPVKTVS